ncbi:hypothetical protein BN1002_00728 [Bacillus sp. B-jedd]|nr:hypothetical protein BN1002_00728 [Bacillus sp. B-jedd]
MPSAPINKETINTKSTIHSAKGKSYLGEIAFLLSVCLTSDLENDAEAVNDVVKPLVVRF